MHMRRYFWLNREILQNKHFQYFDRQKRDMTELKLVWPVKNYFEPWASNRKPALGQWSTSKNMCPQ